MNFAEQIRNSLNWVYALDVEEFSLDDRLQSSPDGDLLFQKIFDVISKYEIPQDAVPFRREALGAVFLWKNQNRKYFDIILDRIIESDIFRETSICHIRRRDIPTLEFCRFLIDKYLRTPARFQRIDAGYKYDFRYDGRERNPLAALLNGVFYEDYPLWNISPLRLLVTLIPIRAEKLVELLTKIPYPLLQYNICYDCISELADHFPDQIAKRMAILVRSFPLLQKDSCNAGQRAFLEMFRAVWQYVKYAEEKSDINPSSAIVRKAFFTAVSLREDAGILVPVFGCFLINASDGELYSEDGKNIWHKTSRSFLNELKAAQKAELNLNDLWCICRENSRTSIEDVHRSFQKEGLELNTRTSCSAAFLLCRYWESPDIALQKELLLLAMESNDRLLATCSYKADENQSLWHVVQEFILQKDELLDFWINLRSYELGQKFYRYRFQYYHQHKQYSGYSIKVYFFASLFVIDGLVESDKVEKAEQFWGVVWKNFINMIYLSWGVVEQEFASRLLWHLLCLKVAMISKGAADDMDAALQSVPSIRNFSENAGKYLAMIKKEQ